MTPILLVFLAGLAGSAHCIGMCGGFACAIGGHAARGGAAGQLLRHGLYNLGRLSSYGFIGVVAGHAGTLLVGHAGEATAGSTAQRALALLSGALMLYIGLRFLGLVGRAAHSGGSAFGLEPLAQALRQLVKAPAPTAPLALGVLNGLLPCPLVYAFAAQAAASGGAVPGLVVMTAFGLGTFPAMLAMGGLGHWLRRAAPAAAPSVPGGVPISWRTRGVPVSWRTHSVRVAGAFIVLLGLITLARGVLPIGMHGH